MKRQQQKDSSKEVVV